MLSLAYEGDSFRKVRSLIIFTVKVGWVAVKSFQTQFYILFREREGKIGSFGMWDFTWPPVERFVLDYINPLGRQSLGAAAFAVFGFWTKIAGFFFFQPSKHFEHYFPSLRREGSIVGK